MTGAGGRRHRITVQQPSEGRSTSGAVTDTWSTYATRWASMTSPGGDESYRGGERDAKRRIQFGLPYDSLTMAITPAMRVSYDGRTFQVHAAYEPKGARREIVLDATEDV